MKNLLFKSSLKQKKNFSFFVFLALMNLYQVFAEKNELNLVWIYNFNNISLSQNNCLDTKLITKAPIINLAKGVPIAVSDDEVYTPGFPKDIQVLDNDTKGAKVVVTSVELKNLDLPIGSTVSSDGKTATVIGEGTWTVSIKGIVTFTPFDTFKGNPTHIKYTVKDVLGNLSYPVPIRLVKENTVIAENDSNDTFLNTKVSGHVLVNDSDTEGDFIILNTTPIIPPTNGEIDINFEGEYTYTPNTSYVGEDKFVYEICDEKGACDTATVTITVKHGQTAGINTALVATDDANTTEVNKVIKGNLISNDYDPNGDSFMIEVNPITQPIKGKVVINPDGTYIYTPNPKSIGKDKFIYEICDGKGSCDKATVVITILADNGKNDTYANEDTFNTDLNNQVSGDLLLNDIDLDGDKQGINTTPIKATSNGSLVINPNGTFKYIPNKDFIGTDSFVYEVCDDKKNCDKATVIITVNPKSGILAPTPNVLDVIVRKAFSPNGDGFNDTFYITNIEKHENTVALFNRWGNTVYKANNYKNDWDGKSIGDNRVKAGILVPTGTYSYMIVLKDTNKVIRGWVYISTH